MRSTTILKEVYAQCAEGLAHGFRHAHPDIAMDSRGYVANPKSNLIPGVELADFEDDPRAGAGAELDGKFLAVHSSSALVVNCFAPLRNGSIPLELGQHRGLKIVGFEQKFPTGLPRAQPPHLDVIAKNASGLVAIESKCLEYLSPAVAKFSDRYKGCITEERRDARPWFQEMLRLMGKSGAQYGLLNAAQLIKHALGLIHAGEDVALIYLYWEPLDHALSPLFHKHRDEITEFAERVAGGKPSFAATAELWDAWDRRGDAGLCKHVQHLRERYEVPAWSWEGVSWVNGRITNAGLLDRGD
jgi:hypothetical protein